MKPHTQEYILEQLQHYYGVYQYDYSKVQYINSNNAIIIGCPEHGDFNMIPYKLFKNSLPLCSKCKRKLLGKNVSDINSFTSKANIIHSNQYDYTNSVYVGNSSPITITCHTHGEFTITPEEHISAGRGCPSCAKENIRLTRDEVIKRAIEMHGPIYTYHDFTYTKILQPITITCQQGHTFEQKIATHLNGHGCPACSRKSTTDEFIEKSLSVHGNTYSYSKTKYDGNITPVTITCPKHGDFKTKPAYHLQGYGCPKCSRHNQNSLYLKKLQEKAPIIHNNKYDYSKAVYYNSNTPISILCPTHGEFKQRPSDHLNGCGCPTCANEALSYSSSYETELIEFIKQNTGTTIKPGHLMGRKEIDIYLPDFGLGIEVNGCYWHSHLLKSPDYHKIKSDFFATKGIKIFHIWEHQWVNPIKQNIVKSMLLNKLNLTPNKIFARKCTIHPVSSENYKSFCTTNHIQGHSPTQIKLGLYYDGVLVACMGFSKLRINLGNKQTEGKYELVRYCTLLNTNIVGGASKLLKHFEKTYNPQYLVSYSDNDYSSGNLYKSLNFGDGSFTNISYMYYDNKTGVLKNRYAYRKSELIKMGYDPSLTEFEITHKMGLYRLHNSGTYRWIKTY